MSIGRSNSAVFTSPDVFRDRQAHSERRLDEPVQAHANAVVRVQFVPRLGGGELRVSGLVALRGPQAMLTFRMGTDGEIDESYPPVTQKRPLLPPGTTL